MKREIIAVINLKGDNAHEVTKDYKRLMEKQMQEMLGAQSVNIVTVTDSKEVYE